MQGLFLCEKNSVSIKQGRGGKLISRFNLKNNVYVVFYIFNQKPLYRDAQRVGGGGTTYTTQRIKHKGTAGRVSQFFSSFKSLQENKMIAYFHCLTQTTITDKGFQKSIGSLPLS